MSPPDAKHQRRWFQFSLRALLIATAAAAGLAFAYVKLVEPYRLQREAMAAIIQLGGMCETKTPDSWVSYLDNKAQDVVVVDLRKCDNLADLLPLVTRLPQVEALDLRGTSISDEQMAQLTPLTKLRMLSVDNTGITDAGLATIGAFPDLRHISASATKVGDAGLALMAGLPRLRYLDVSDTWPVSDRHVSVSDEGVSYLSRSKTLRTLVLDGTKITDEGIAHLETMTQLNQLSIKLTQVSLTAMKRLQAALPQCYIARD